MTKRKKRWIQPYTCNIAVSGVMEDPLFLNILGKYFLEKDCLAISTALYALVNRYHHAYVTNEDRKITKYQRNDRHELIETIRELRNRMLYWHIPTPLYEPAKRAYSRVGNSSPTLGQELAELDRRLGNLENLFESIEIPTPKKTNPGKPEKEHFINEVFALFDLHYPKRDQAARYVQDTKFNYASDVVEFFSLSIKIPR